MIASHTCMFRFMHQSQNAMPLQKLA